MIFCRYLYLFLLFFVLSPDLSASVKPAEIRNEVAAETPVKPKKAGKKVKKNPGTFAGTSNGLGFLKLLPWLVLLSQLGLIFLGIGVPLSILWLWITGLVLLILPNLYIFIQLFVFLKSFNNPETKIKKLIGALAVRILLFITSFATIILGIIYLIWGLIAAFPVLWISGLIAILLAILTLVLLFKVDF